MAGHGKIGPRPGVAAHPVPAALALYPVAPPCYGKPRQTHFKSTKIPAFAVARVMANIPRPERMEQVESFFLLLVVLK